MTCCVPLRAAEPGVGRPGSRRCAVCPREPYPPGMSTFTIARTAHTSAPAGRVLPLLQDFHEWVRWSPWEGVDPDLERTYTGPGQGVGSAYAWSGNRKAGAGEMTMTRADEWGVELDLAFTRPFTATNHVAIDVAPTPDGGSDLRWTMTGEQGLVGRLIDRVLPMEKMLSRDFDKGLAQLAAAAEGRA